MSSRRVALSVLAVAAVAGVAVALWLGSGDGDDGSDASATPALDPDAGSTDTTVDTSRLGDTETPEFQRSNEPCPPGLAELDPPRHPTLGALLDPVSDLAGAANLVFVDADRGFVATREGRIHAFDGEVVSLDPLIDLSSDTSTQHDQGLVGLAVGPDGEWLYVNRTDGAGDSVVSAIRITPTGLSGPARDILTLDQPSAQHNGGSMVFDSSGAMYVTFGDGGGQGDPLGNAQNPSTSLGSILRLIPRPDSPEPVVVPDDNPFVGGSGAVPLAWAIGVRNPFRLAIDPLTDALWVADVGQQCLEEITVVGRDEAGANLGWNRHEGTRSFIGDPLADHHEPILEYRHGRGRCAVIGGVVLRGGAPELEGHYLFTDLCGGELFALDPDTAAVTRVGDAETDRPVSVVASPDGDIYIVDLETGVMRVELVG